jgi:hypothetical protein
VIEEIEQRPTAALKYSWEKREYYQPPKQTSGYRYTYQFYVGLGTKRLIEHAPKLESGASTGGKIVWG